MSLDGMPFVHACINTTVAVLLLAALVAIRQGRRLLHQRLMVAALVLSTIFLASYLIYHFFHGATPFLGTGNIRVVYFTVLITHTVLAVINLPLIIMTVWRAYKGRFDLHRKIAKVTWVIWFYVAVTGPIVYWMLWEM